jgi:16S rRNA (guanine966-N2)-methyltransferase
MAMRVVAGELKGRRLASPKSSEVRPTADRVREALFSILGDVSGARVLDLFAGTGALAIEALSRGAAHATLVDTELSTARRNVSGLGLDDRATVVRSDAIEYLRRAGRGMKSSAQAAGFDLIFCDPPYRLASRIEEQLDSLIPPVLAPEGRVIVESAVKDPLRLSLPLLADKRYGDTAIHIHAGAAA